jgi:hypothetical protein
VTTLVPRRRNRLVMRPAGVRPASMTPTAAIAPAIGSTIATLVATIVVVAIVAKAAVTTMSASTATRWEEVVTSAPSTEP